MHLGTERIEKNHRFTQHINIVSALQKLRDKTEALLMAASLSTFSPSLGGSYGIDNFLQSKIDSESSFEMKWSIFLFFLKFGSVFMKEKKLENGFPIVFSEMDLSDLVGYFSI